MKTDKYLKLLEFVKVRESFIPTNKNSIDLIQNLEDGELCYFSLNKSRDLKLHKNYFLFLNYIYDFLTPSFKKNIPSKIFYKWIQHLKKDYKVLFSFADTEKMENIISDCIDGGMSIKNAGEMAVKYGKTDMIEYESISFAKMNDKRFKEYIKEQLPFLYSDVVEKLFDEKISKNIIETIEKDFEIFFSKLDKKEFKKK